MHSTETCKQRYQYHSERLERLKQRHRQLGTARLAGCAAGLALLWATEAYAPAWTLQVLAVLMMSLVASSRWLSRVEDRTRYARHARNLYAPVALGQPRKGREGTSPEPRDATSGHPYAADLDILSPGGLVDRITLANTWAGAARLIEMLVGPVDERGVRERQEAVRELVPRVELRERLYVAGAVSAVYIRTRLLREWADQAEVSVPRWLPASCAALAACTLAAAGLAAFSTTPFAYPALAALVVAEFLVSRYAFRVLRAEPLGAERIHRDVEHLQALVEILEEQKFRSTALQGLASELRSSAGRVSASRLARQFCRLVSLFEARRNQILALVGPLVLYGTQVSLALERWRSRNRKRVLTWMETVGHFEAYSSLACFAFENPSYPWPKLSTGGPSLHASDLAHPLLDATAVGNDLSIDRTRPVLVVSGANMAGKSTLLRTIGVNLVLAYAGAPVRARSMEFSCVDLIASIRVQDSLAKGRSRFSEELRQIRPALEGIRAGRSTLLLVDELFAGTNSFDRFEGAVALAEFVLEEDSGLTVLSTHDREVTRWAEKTSDRIGNVHFRDELEQQGVRFDFRLYEGPALRGNALELMRLAGLNVQSSPRPRSE